MSKKIKSNEVNQMWGGRFSSSPSWIMEKINVSIDFDKKLFEQDILGSKVHTTMLAKQGIISSEEAQKIIEGLKVIRAEIVDGSFVFSRDLEDIHMNIEARLTSLIGSIAGKMHTARSRNDQVALDLRLWIKEKTLEITNDLKKLLTILLDKAEEHHNTIMPGFTHLQTAQPVTFGHHCMAYVEMFGRDISRFFDSIERLDECPLGAAALAGTSFPIDRHFTAKELGFREPTRNSIDSVSDRDFILECLSHSAICAMHMSRLAEEIILWSTPQFNFVRLSDAFSTGSSIMPQKRNPDGAELVRAKTGRINGALLSLLTIMKGLPLAYSKDMQEDKEPVFDALETLQIIILAISAMIEDLTVNKDRLQEAATKSHSTATDLADWLVSHAGLPFREAHYITGCTVSLAEKNQCELAKLPLAMLQQISPVITSAVYDILKVESSISSRKSFGGTCAAEVLKQVTYWRNRIQNIPKKI
ncbi:argininosuccinate lyase [Candidatus Liberibacter asiaticus]|uniref:Argininosuccinate lyase n=2 Tax=Liberibacter asiaticus TaxID=34021 RepID=C6XHV0_LIBAP|nr:argininosuccinate lyase [Candidatus Liberibacter asiaticus str. psy62]AGH16607.1 argininosuccinate lyase [Candidatus Liberibacter asiaticus str. gxpsy]ALK06998.2 argininosuccinate lyase [Candidatus Liberibacter asiaticus]BAP26128.1 argininosuccinate lyase [Candidatus Liberibacter asiaticus str. Ishi-1]AWL13793.1 argininosuccinate lyase [Candidatus Liberibacter asiaticus]